MNKRRILLLILLAAAGNLGAMEISLETYLSLVEENSKDLYLAETEQDLALNQERLIRSQLLPMVAGEVSYQRNFIEQNQPSPTGLDLSTGNFIMGETRINRYNDLSWNVGVQQNVFNMAIFTALKASRQYREMTGTIFEASRQGILTAAKKVYYMTLLLEEVYKVKQFTEQNAYESYLEIQAKYESELASELEVNLAEVNWMITVPETSQAARNWDLAMSNLKLLGGIPTEEEVVLTETLAGIPQTDADLSLGEILGSRPDYQVLVQEQLLREINLKREYSSFYPTLALTFGYGWQSSSDDFSFDEEIMTGEGMQIGLSLSVPIFLGGSRFTQVQRAKIDLARSRTQMEQKQEEITTEIHNLRMLLEESENRIEVAEKTLITAEKAYEITELSAQNGLATQLDLKDARLSLEGAKLNFFMANYDFLDAYFSWQQAIGEGDQLP